MEINAFHVIRLASLSKSELLEKEALWEFSNILDPFLQVCQENQDLVAKS